MDKTKRKNLAMLFVMIMLVSFVLTLATGGTLRTVFACIFLTQFIGGVLIAWPLYALLHKPDDKQQQ